MDVLTILIAAFVVWILYRIVLYILKERYFASEKFLAHKREISSFVAEHNELGRYISEIRRNGTFGLGSSSTGLHAHLAEFQNTSRWNYRRDRNTASYRALNVHNCSLQVVRNASMDPLKYLMKYFNINADEACLSEVEKLGDDINRLEEALANLSRRESVIAKSIDPPKFILKYYAEEFMSHVGVELSPVTVPYPEYIFEYVSAGGNSSQRTVITLNTPTIDSLVETISQKIRWRKSVAGQRALMTSKLRDAIKERDSYTCQNCSVSLADEPHLLLEVDHIVPLSKGGTSTPDNLQTLCWKCNRTKANKMPFAGHSNSMPATSGRCDVMPNAKSGGAPPRGNSSLVLVSCVNCGYRMRVSSGLSKFQCEQCGRMLKRKVPS